MASNASLPVSSQGAAASLDVRQLRRAFYKTISAILFLLDFVSNVFVAYQYYEFSYKGKSFENLSLRPATSRAQILFVFMVSLMVFGHVSCFIFFLVVGLPGDERSAQPWEILRRAVTRYFLPVAQLLRALQAFDCCASDVGKDSRPTPEDEDRVEVLYAIVSATTDGGPLFLMQYTAFTVYTSDYNADDDVNNWSPGRLLTLSLCLSAVSAAWNVSRAVVYLLPSMSRWLTLPIGAFTLSTLTVRCTTFVSILGIFITRYIRRYYDDGDSKAPGDVVVLLGAYTLIIIAGPFIGYGFLSWEEPKDMSDVNCRNRRIRPTFKAAGFTYVSFSFGPLYPFVSLAQTSKTMGISTRRFQARLFFYATSRWIVELSFMSALLIKKWSPCNPIPEFTDYSLSNAPFFPMMPCHLYISALAIGLPIAVLSQVLFQKLVQTQVASTSQNDYAESEVALAAAGAYEVGGAILGIVGLTTI